MATGTVRAVIFDYGGVLLAEDGDAFDAAGARHGLPPGRVWAAYHDIPEHRASRTGRIDHAAYLRAVVLDLARDVGEPRALALVAEFESARRGAAPVTPEMDEVLARLRGRVRLGLLSNAGAGALAHFAQTGVAARFDDVLCSGEVGLAKPDPAVFRLAASRLGVTPPECAFVDDLERHVLAARAVSMRAHWYRRSRHGELLRFLAEVGALPPPPQC